MNLFKAIDFIPDSKGYHVSTCAEARSKNPHSHDFYEIAYVIEGYGTHYTKEQSDFVKEGSYIFISPGVEHCTVSPADKSVSRIRICNCLLSAAYFHDTIRRFLDLESTKDTALHSLLKSNTPFCLVLSDTKANTIKKAVESIKYEYELVENHINDIIRNHVSNFLLETSRIYEMELAGDKLPTGQNILIQELLCYIKSNLDLPLTLTSLAKQIHFSPEYLSRYFKKHMGQTLTAYIMELRMQKAKELLSHTSYSITEISYLCGYSSSSNFRKYFSQMFGISPSEYRKRTSYALK